MQPAPLQIPGALIIGIVLVHFMGSNVFHLHQAMFGCIALVVIVAWIWKYKKPLVTLGLALLGVSCCMRLLMEEGLGHDLSGCMAWLELGGMGLIALSVFPRQQGSSMRWTLGLAVVLLISTLLQFYLVLKFGRTLTWQSLAYAVLNMVAILGLLPAIEVAIDGRASNGRLLVLIGWQTWWMKQILDTAVGSSWIAQGELGLSALIMGAAFIAAGLVVETLACSTGLRFLMLSSGGVLALWMAGIASMQGGPKPFFLNWLIGVGGMLFFNGMIMLMGYLSAMQATARQIQEQKELFNRTRLAKTEFLASLTHELRTPINAVIGLSGVMADGLVEEVNPTQQELAREIRLAGERLLALINQILEFSKLDAAKMAIERMPMAIVSWLNGVCAPFRGRAASKGLLFQVHTEKAPAEWSLDPVAMRQAMKALLEDALEQTRNGGVDVCVMGTCQDLLITVTGGVSGSAHGERQELGLDRENGLAHREEDINQGKDDRFLGLGLAIARHYIQLHGGDLSMQEGPDMVVYRLRLPLQGSAAGPDDVAQGQGMERDDEAFAERWLMIPEENPAPPRFFQSLAMGLAGLFALTALSGEIMGRLVLAFVSAVGAWLAWQAGSTAVARLAAMGLLASMIAYLLGVSGLVIGWPAMYQMRMLIFIVGELFLLGSFATMQPRRRPRFSLLGAGTASAAAVLVCAEAGPDFWRSPDILIMLVDTACLVAGVGAFEGVIVGRCRWGRVLSFGGMYTVWLGDYLYSLLAASGHPMAWSAFVDDIYVFSMVAIGLGFYLDARRWSLWNWPMIMVPGSALLAWSIGAAQLGWEPATLQIWIVVGSVIIFFLTFSILLTYHNRALATVTRLEQAQVLARKASHAMTTFLGKLAAQVRISLDGIGTLARVLEPKDQAPPGEVNEYVQAIRHSVHHLGVLLADITDIANIEEGVVVFNEAPCHIPDLMQGCLALFKERAMRKNITLQLEVQDGLGKIYCDAVKVKQMLFNLLSNAIKFTPERGLIQLSAALESREAVLQHADAPGFERDTLGGGAWFVAFRVSDSGIGITETEQRRLFQPYVQLQAGKAQLGTGLGLSLVRRFAALHGGTVMLHSKPGVGSTFTVWIPASGYDVTAPHRNVVVQPVPSQS
jgi:signal transduction histidine kinase